MYQWYSNTTVLLSLLACAESTNEALTRSRVADVYKIPSGAFREAVE